jgi:hypothetical protein
MTFQYSAANDQVVFNLNDSIKSNVSSILNTKPGFIRIKLIKLDPAPNFDISGSTSKLKSVSSGNSQSEYYNSENGHETSNTNNNNAKSKSSSSPLISNNFLLDPYCAVNVKEMIKSDTNISDIDSIDYKKKKS